MNINIANKSYDAMRRFGLLGFAFFFVKGVLWLTAPFVIAWLF